MYRELWNSWVQTLVLQTSLKEMKAQYSMFSEGKLSVFSLSAYLSVIHCSVSYDNLSHVECRILNLLESVSVAYNYHNGTEITLPYRLCRALLYNFISFINIFLIFYYAMIFIFFICAMIIFGGDVIFRKICQTHFSRLVFI